MRFLCIVYGCAGPEGSALGEHDHGIYPDVIANWRDLAERGHLIASSPLRSPDAAKTVQVRDDGALVTDGPFAETKEQVGGFYLIDAAGMDEAVQLAATMPPARIGAIEVRPLFEIPVD